MARKHQPQQSLFTSSGAPRKRRARIFARGKKPGRPPKPGGRLRHARRPELARRFPVHITWRTLPGLPTLRGPAPMGAIRAAFGQGKDRFGFKLVHFSVQKGHVHMLCEAEDRSSLRRGLQGLAVRVAKGLNRLLRRRGKVFADRYHSRVLTSPTEARWALGYVLCNSRRHNAELLTPKRYPRRWLDSCCSSARHFSGFIDGTKLVPWREPDPSSPVVSARSWLLASGWLRVGRLPTDHLPGPSGPRVG